MPGVVFNKDPHGMTLKELDHELMDVSTRLVNIPRALVGAEVELQLMERYRLLSLCRKKLAAVTSRLTLNKLSSMEE